MVQNRRSSDNAHNIDDFTHTPTPDTSDKISAIEILLHTDFEESDDFSAFPVEELSWKIDRWNKIDRKDIIILEFQKPTKEKLFHFTLKFYVTRSYSYKITGYYMIEEVWTKRRSSPHYWEIKYTKIKWGKRKIIDATQNWNDMMLNEFQSLISESILKNITILKPPQNIASLTTWVKGKINSFLKG